MNKGSEPEGASKLSYYSKQDRRVGVTYHYHCHTVEGTAVGATQHTYIHIMNCGTC